MYRAIRYTIVGGHICTSERSASQHPTGELWPGPLQVSLLENWFLNAMIVLVMIYIKHYLYSCMKGQIGILGSKLGRRASSVRFISLFMRFLCRTAALAGPYGRRVITVGGWVAVRGDPDILQTFPRVGLHVTVVGG